MHTVPFNTWIVQANGRFFNNTTSSVGDFSPEQRTSQKISEAKLFADKDAARAAIDTVRAKVLAMQTGLEFAPVEVSGHISLSLPEDPDQLNDNQQIVYAAQDENSPTSQFLARGSSKGRAPKFTSMLNEVQLYSNPPKKDGFKPLPLVLTLPVPSV